MTTAAKPKPLGISLVDHLVKGSRSPTRRKEVLRALVAPLKPHVDLAADQPSETMLGMPLSPSGGMPVIPQR